MGIDLIDWLYTWGFAHYGFMVVLAFLSFYVTSYVLFRDDWGVWPFVLTVAGSAFLATAWPAFYAFWVLVMVALGPARFIFRFLEEMADKYIIRSDKNTKRKVHL